MSQIDILAFMNIFKTNWSRFHIFMKSGRINKVWNSLAK